MDGFDAWLARAIRRLPLGGRVAALQNRLASFGEQGLQGVANLAVNVILARGLSHEGFATIGVMLGIHYFVLGLHRTAVVLPFILDASGDEAAALRAERRWWWLNLASLGVIAAVLALASATVALATVGHPEDRWFSDGLLLTVPVTPALLLFEFGRRVLYQRRLPATAALASAVYLVLNLGTALVVSHAAPTPAAGGLSWIVAGLGGAAVATLAAPPGRPRLREGWRLWWANRSFAFWQALTNLPYAVYNSSVVVVVGLFGGAGAAAAFTAARTLTNPAISMVTAVDSLDKPRAARGLAAGGLAGLRGSVGRTRRLLAILTGVYLGALVVFARPVLHLAFGDAYADQVDEIRVLALAFFLISMNQPSETFLIVLRASKLLLATRIVAAAVAVASLALAKPYGLMGACLALLLTHVINLANLRASEGVAARRWAAANPATAPA